MAVAGGWGKEPFQWQIATEREIERERAKGRPTELPPEFLTLNE